MIVLEYSGGNIFEVDHSAPSASLTRLKATLRFNVTEDQTAFQDLLPQPHHIVLCFKLSLQNVMKQ